MLGFYKYHHALNISEAQGGVGAVVRDPATGRRIYACQHPGCSFVAKAITFLRYHAPVHTGSKVRIYLPSSVSIKVQDF